MNFLLDLESHMTEKLKELLELQDSEFVNDALIRKNWNSACQKDLLKVFCLYPEVFDAKVLNAKMIN